MHAKLKKGRKRIKSSVVYLLGEAFINSSKRALSQNLPLLPRPEISVHIRWQIKNIKGLIPDQSRNLFNFSSNTNITVIITWHGIRKWVPLRWLLGGPSRGNNLRRFQNGRPNALYSPLSLFFILWRFEFKVRGAAGLLGLGFFPSRCRDGKVLGPRQAQAPKNTVEFAVDSFHSETPFIQTTYVYVRVGVCVFFILLQPVIDVLHGVPPLKARLQRLPATFHYALIWRTTHWLFLFQSKTH